VLPPDLQKLHEELDRLRTILTGNTVSQAALDDVRRLIAGGVLICGFIRQEISNPVPQLLVASLICEALWPLIIAPNFTMRYHDALRELASPYIVGLVVNARLYLLHNKCDRARMRVLVTELIRELQKPQYAEGCTKLLEDLCDPQRGGAALGALIMLRDRSSTKADDFPALVRLLIAGALGAAVEGVIGNRADALVVEAWERLTEVLKPITAHPPDDAHLHVERGYAYLDQRDNVKAHDEFTQAIRLDPTCAEAYLILGDMSRATADSYRAKAQEYHSSAFGQAAYSHDLAAIDNYRKVLDLSQNPSLRRKAKQALKSLRANN
jgi:tetratricopeptide (TPR) repeat protein